MSMCMSGAVSVRVSVAVAAVLMRMGMFVIVFVNLVLSNEDSAEGRKKAIAEIEAKAREISGC